jgi:hypothetical protein
MEIQLVQGGKLPCFAFSNIERSMAVIQIDGLDDQVSVQTSQDALMKDRKLAYKDLLKPGKTKQYGGGRWPPNLRMFISSETRLIDAGGKILDEGNRELLNDLHWSKCILRLEYTEIPKYKTRIVCTLLELHFNITLDANNKFRIRIKASDLAKLVGFNPYESQEDAINDLINKQLCSEKQREEKQRDMKPVDELSRVTLVEARLRTKRALSLDTIPLVAGLDDVEFNSEHGQGSAERARKRLKHEISMVHDEILQVKSSPFDAVHVDKIGSTLVSQEAQQLIRKTIQCAEGSISEVSDLAKCMVETFSDNCTYSKLLKESEMYIYVLVGMIDAREADSNRVVEAKRRKNRLFGSIKEYEAVQLEAYLHITDTRNLGTVQVETFGDCQLVHNYEHDPDLWARIMVGFENVIKTCDQTMYK